MTRVHEPGGILEFFSAGSAKPLDLEDLKIDSDEALRITLALPSIQDLDVRFAEFDLERGYGGLPVWKLRLYGSVRGSDSSGATLLGYVILLVEDGKVLKETLSRKQPRTK